MGPGPALLRTGTMCRPGHRRPRHRRPRHRPPRHLAPYLAGTGERQAPGKGHGPPGRWPWHRPTRQHWPARAARHSH